MDVDPRLTEFVHCTIILDQITIFTIIDDEEESEPL